MRNVWWRSLTTELARAVQETLRPERVNIWLADTALNQERR
jgi:hypothetical protein